MVGWVARRHEQAWRAPLAWAAVGAVLLLPVPWTIYLEPGRSSTAAQAVSFRSGWWSMLMGLAWRHPWLGYGPGSTSTLGAPGTPSWGQSAHDLYLEATVYAGVPGGVAMLLFVAATVLIALARARRLGGSHVAVAAVVVFYGLLSLVEPVLLNGAPSSLVVPLVAAAACAAGGDDAPDRTVAGTKTSSQ